MNRMTYAELTAAVTAAGHHMPWHPQLADILSLPSTDSGKHRTYTSRQAEFIVARARILQLCTDGGQQSSTLAQRSLHRRAARLLARAPTGYVWISDGRTGWSYDPPRQALRRGAAVWPAPAMPRSVDGEEAT